MNSFESNCILELRTIFSELLLKNKCVLEPCCQRVQEYTVLRISLEIIIVSGSQELEPSWGFAFWRRKYRIDTPTYA